MDTNRLQAIFHEMEEYEHGPVMNSLILEGLEILALARCEDVTLHDLGNGGRELVFRDETTGVPWLAVLVPHGARYGRFHQSGLRAILNDGRPLIEFWDRRYDYDREHHAQFVSRYYDATLFEHYGELCLDTATPKWALDARSLALVKKYLINRET